LPAAAQAQQSVQFKSSDGVEIFGTYYAAPDSSRPVILLFHQAGSNHFEYAPIAPKLVAAGFSCLAIDQRWGGEMWGHTNETVKKLGHTETAVDKVTDLEADLDAALAWARTHNPHHKFILWGSSYSASLVFVVAAQHPDEVAGILSFSPGEYFDSHPTMIEDAAMKVRVPVFVTSENDSDQLRQATKIYDAVASRDKVHYKAQFAVHGSSTLRTDRNAKGAAANWAAVMKFLKQFEK
jgi:dienelactone hydrolase